MMINMQTIRKRQMHLNFKTELREGNSVLLIENCSTSNSIDTIETYFKNWPYANTNNVYEFKEAANILESFIERATIKSNKNKAISLFLEMVVPKAHNMKAAKEVVSKLNIDDSSILEACTEYVVCDRIIKNHNSLSKKGIDNLLNETSLSSEEGIDSYVTSVCEFIDNINMSFATKYNVALENSIYLLDKQGISYDRKNVLESVNDYFFINLDNEKLEAMDVVLRESDMYSDEDKEIFNEFTGPIAALLLGLAYIGAVVGAIYISNRISNPSVKESFIYINIDNLRKFEKNNNYLIATTKDTTIIEKINNFKTLNKKIAKFKTVTYSIDGTAYLILSAYEFGKCIRHDIIYTDKTRTKVYKFPIYDANNKYDMWEILPDGKIEESAVYEDFKDTAKDKASTIVSQLKAIPNKTPESFKDAIKKLYTKSPNNIIEETPNLLIWIRKFLIFGTIAINPFLAIVAFIADMVIQAKFQRAETEKMITSFKNEKDKAETKLAKCTNEKKEEKLKAYIKELDKNIAKLEEYQDTLYSEKENDERSSSMYEESTEFEFEKHITLKEYMTIYHPKVVLQMYNLRSQLDKYLKSRHRAMYDTECVLLTDMAELKKFENCNIDSVLSYIGVDGKIYVDLAKFLGLRYKELNTKIDQRDILSDICDNLQLNIDYDFCIMYEGEEDMYTIYLSFNSPIILDDGTNRDIQEQVHNSILKSYATIKILEEQVSNISDLDMEYLLSYVDDNIDTIDMDTVNCIGQFSVVASDIIDPSEVSSFFEEKATIIRNSDDSNKYVKLAKIQEGLNGIASYTRRDNTYLGAHSVYSYNSLLEESMQLLAGMTIHEISFVSTMNIVQQKLKANIAKMSDKEKQMSRQLDFAVDSMTGKMKDSITNDNREAVIKGSIVPSASKVLKAAIISGVGYAINPALAVVGILGGIAASKHATNKEKQCILDEIDVELKLIDKKISLADRSDDMKAMEELLKLQQKLKKEKSRIEYNKKDYVPANKE